MKQIPYGIDDYDRIIQDNYYYIDKTRYIKALEERNSYILFVRPRRMGKSLFTNMLMSYYDIDKASLFDNLFGCLWIGKNKTKWANKFLVLKFDFSKVSYGIEDLQDKFSNYCTIRLNDFFTRYHRYFTDEEISYCMSQPYAKDIINVMISITKRKGLLTYLFIDEYDNFSNTVLAAHGVEAHRQITHGEGFYRDFFKTCKGAFDRIFMTGVTPVTYDDLTSGFNIAEMVALHPQFDQTIGVSETELREMIEYYRSVGRISRDTDSIIAEMKPWYDNFCFAEDCYGTEPPLYNTDMVLRYIQELILSGNPPKEMLDMNARTDYQKLNYLVMTDDIAHRQRRTEIIRDICAKGYTTGQVKEMFPAARCGEESNFKSMLYYFGTLTFGGWDDEGETILRVPNKTMGDLYLQYMLQIIEHEGLQLSHDWTDLQRCIADAAIRHEWRVMTDKIASLYSQYSSLRNNIRGEADVQGFLRGLLCLNRYFDIWPELELGNGYSDILLLPKGEPRCPTKHSYVIELKYMRANDMDIDKHISDACRQLDKYASDLHLTTSPMLRGTQLTKIYLIFRGNELIIADTIS